MDGAPLLWRAPVYESTSTVSMENMRVTRAYVTEEQPRVAETTHPTPPHQKKTPGDHRDSAQKNGEKIKF